MNQVIKLSHPSWWVNGVKGLRSNYDQQLPNKKGVWENSKFIINKQVNECDIWIVHGDLDKEETVVCKGTTVFIISEEVDQRVWHGDFLDQFDVVLGTQAAINHKNYLRGQYVCPWQINKSFDELKLVGQISKCKDLSAIISDSTWKEGHKRRYAFANKLKGHFKSRLDWYGRGNTFIEDKWDGLADYRYSVAIENSSHLHYWTEKIADCFLAYTIPVYYGCPNIHEYFPAGSYLQIDIDDFESSIKVIEYAIANNYYKENYNALLEARSLILNEYQFFPAVLKQLSKVNGSALHKRRVTIKPESYFTSKVSVTYYLKRMVEILADKKTR